MIIRPVDRKISQAADRWLANGSLIRPLVQTRRGCSVICGQQATPATAFVDLQVSKDRSAQINGATGASADAGAS